MPTPTLDSLVQNETDVTDTYYKDFGGISEDIIKSLAGVAPLIHALRVAMETVILLPQDDLSIIGSGLITIKDWANYHRKSFAELHNNLIAVDGTYLFPSQRLLTGQVVGVAVGGVTYNSGDDIQLRVSKAVLEAPKDMDWSDLSEAIDFVREAEALIGTSSTPGTYMEYCERRFAMDNDNPYVIVDGPIITQNLATRSTGVQLLKELLDTRPHKRYVGIMKNLNNSDLEFRYHAMALNPGEAYVYGSLRSMWGGERFEERYKGRDEVLDFINGECDDILRCVYKIGYRSFGFECHRNDLPFALSVLDLDSQYTMPGYELPFLLQQIDRIIRHQFNPYAAQALINSGYISNDPSEYHNLIDERENRK